MKNKTKLHFKSPRFLDSRTMVSIALYKEPDKEMDARGGLSARQSQMSSSAGFSENGNLEEEGADEGNLFEGKTNMYQLHAKVKKVYDSKINFYIFAINLKFYKEEDLKEAAKSEFCIMSKFIAFKLARECFVRVLEIPSFKNLKDNLKVKQRKQKELAASEFNNSLKMKNDELELEEAKDAPAKEQSFGQIERRIDVTPLILV